MISVIVTAFMTTVINIAVYEIPQPTKQITEYLVHDGFCFKWTSDLDNKGIRRNSHIIKVDKCPKNLIGHKIKDRAKLKATLRNR